MSHVDPAVPGTSHVPDVHPTFTSCSTGVARSQPVTRTLRQALTVVVPVVLLTTGVACSSGDESSDTSSTSAPPATEPVAPTSPGTGGVTLANNPVPVPAGGTASVQVDWTGQEPRTLMFVTVCRKPTNDPTFQVGIDCSPLSELNPNGTADGNGSVELEVFRGPTPDGDNLWGCFAEGDEAPPGVQVNTTCYVRVTNDVVLNQEDARDVPFTLVDP